MTTPASAIRDEVRMLIELQIATFSKPSRLTSSELSEYHHRAELINQLGGELNRISRMAILEERFGKAA